jgi:hypothetical protein
VIVATEAPAPIASGHHYPDITVLTPKTQFLAARRDELVDASLDSPLSSATVSTGLLSIARTIPLPRGFGRLSPLPQIAQDDLCHRGNWDGDQSTQDAGQFGGDQDGD